MIDGALSMVQSSLAGGIFLIGFALKILKAGPQQIGILASLPIFAGVIQIFGAYIIEKTGRKKMVWLPSIVISRVLWILIIMLPLPVFSVLEDLDIWILVAVFALSSLFGSLSYVAWVSWMSDLVPEDIRGTYFGKRNMVNYACGMIAMLLGGKFISMWESRFSERNPYGFPILFLTGLLAGLVAAWVFSRIPEEPESTKKEKNAGFDFSVFSRPLKDRNFLTLTFCFSFLTFAIQIAAPFYGVYMIENLKIDFSTITLFGVFSTLAAVFMMKIWGPISDRLGNKPIIVVSSGILILVPFMWVIAVPGKYYLPVLIAHVLSGAFTAGIMLSQFNILIKLSPKEGRSIYLALNAAIVGLVGGIAPILGGSLLRVLGDINFAFFAYSITNLHIIFIISSIFLIFTIFFVQMVKEPAAATPVAVIMQLRNDLNPQTGIVGTTDFIMVELKRTEGILEKVDLVTNGLAEKSEKGVERVLDKGEKFLEKPIKKLKDFLKSED